MSVPDTYYEQLRENLKGSKVKITEDLDVLQVRTGILAATHNISTIYFETGSRRLRSCFLSPLRTRAWASWWTMTTMDTYFKSSPNPSRTGPRCSWRSSRDTTTRVLALGTSNPSSKPSKPTRPPEEIWPCWHQTETRRTSETSSFILTPRGPHVGDANVAHTPC